MCPFFLRFSIHTYCGHKMRTKWNTNLSGAGPWQQGGVLSPLLFNVYLDDLVSVICEGLEFWIHLPLITQTSRKSRLMDWIVK